MNKFGLLDYELLGGYFNLGDYVQSIAARQYLPEVSTYLNREYLNEYTGDTLQLIMNGWFMHKPLNWPPSPNINPLFVSFHMNRSYMKAMLSPYAIAYMKDAGPIGCRDYYTAEVLEKAGIDSYYSCCLTTTLPGALGDEEERSGILFVDVMHNLPNTEDYFGMSPRYLLSHLKSGNIFKSHKKRGLINELLSRVPEQYGNEVDFLDNKIKGEGIDVVNRFRMADDYLKRLASAKLVITSRIHCALPCLALNTPVIFIKHGQSSMANIYRFRGILDHFNVIDLDGDMKKHNFESNFLEIEDIDYDKPLVNPQSHIPFARVLRDKCLKFTQ